MVERASAKERARIVTLKEAKRVVPTLEETGETTSVGSTWRIKDVERERSAHFPMTNRMDASDASIAVRSSTMPRSVRGSRVLLPVEAPADPKQPRPLRRRKRKKELRRLQKVEDLRTVKLCRVYFKKQTRCWRAWVRRELRRLPTKIGWRHCNSSWTTWRPRLRLTRMTSCGTAGLIDSGATHPMRGYEQDEDLQNYLKVEVTLASGETASLRMTPGGVMVAENLGVDEVEPIVPLGMMVDKLGCKVVWEKDYFVVDHPRRGRLKATIINGCPQISKRLALQLIKELEKGETDGDYYKMRSVSWEARLQERAWLRTLVHTHPVFQGLPERLLERLVATPSEDLLELPANRRMRKVWKREGCILHLYAGAREGYTFERAMREVSGTSRQVLELDIQRSEKQDLTKTTCYGALLRLALDGHISTLVGGPNCRTRSVLRSYPGGPPFGKIVGRRRVRQAWHFAWWAGQGGLWRRVDVENDCDLPHRKGLPEGILWRRAFGGRLLVGAAGGPGIPARSGQPLEDWSMAATTRDGGPYADGDPTGRLWWWSCKAYWPGNKPWDRGRAGWWEVTPKVDPVKDPEIRNSLLGGRLVWWRR